MKLSDSTKRLGNPYGSNVNKFVPFTMFLHITPIHGKRWESWRDMERLSDEVETLLESFCGNTATHSFDFNIPVAFTPAFGNKPARLTVTGNMCVRSTFDLEPVSERIVIADNREITGAAASNTSNRVPSDDLSDAVAQMKADVESLTGLTVLRLEAAGFIFGSGGMTFPL